jgi:hypothetical protein
MLASSVLGLVAGLSATAAELTVPDNVIPPPVSPEQARHYQDNPAEWAALVARLPRKDAVVPDAPTGAAPPPVVGGTWTAVTAPYPGAGAHNPLLMMDGTVLVHEACTNRWYKLKPTNTGSYVGGTWSQIASMPAGHNPLYFASQVLSDGRVIVNGGEYNPAAPGSCGNPVWSNRGSIYNPTTNTWANVPAPIGWLKMGDAQSVVLSNLVYMLANPLTKETALFNAATLAWTATGAGKFDRHDEEGWSLLQNGLVFTADAYTGTGTCGRNTEIYNRLTGAWTSAGLSPVQLSDCSAGGVGTKSFEVGPLVLRHNGTLVLFSGMATGAPSGTAVYNPTTHTFLHTPNMPAVGGKNYTLADAPGVLLPNGKVLVAASPSPAFATPTHYFEFDLANNIQQITNDAPGSAGLPSFTINFVNLPNGQILKTDNGKGVHVYTPGGVINAAWRPAISKFTLLRTTTTTTTLTRSRAFDVTGTQINGLSEGGSYGDDAQGSTNFPLVRLRNNTTGHVIYCRTFAQSNRSIAPGVLSRASFVVPAGAETGASTAVVVVNGIASPSVAVTVN